MTQKMRTALLAVLCVLFFPLVIDDAVGSSNPSVQTPQAVRAFLESNFEDAQMERGKMLEAGHSDFHPEYTLLFYSRTLDWRDGKSPAWLIGYRLARTGNGVVPFNKIVMVDQYGGVDEKEGGLRTSLPDNCAGDEGITLELRPGLRAFAVSRHVGRHVAYDVRVFTLEPHPRPLFAYSRPIDYKDEYMHAWFSTLYFLDIDGDGTKEICVDRTNRDYAANIKWKEYLLYRYDPRKKSFGKSRAVPEKEFQNWLKRAGGAEQIEHIQQLGPPFSDEGMKTVTTQPTR